MTDPDKPAMFQQVEGGARGRTDEIVNRRFGRLHERKCARPTILTCALYDCQVRNRCRLLDGPGGELLA